MTEKRHTLVIKSLEKSEAARKNGQRDIAWEELEKAHIFGQPYSWLHTYVHWKMLTLGLQQYDFREVIGQVFRLLLAAPASLFRVYPLGNTGRARISAFKPMPIPKEVEKKLKQAMDLQKSTGEA